VILKFAAKTSADTRWWFSHFTGVQTK